MDSSVPAKRGDGERGREEPSGGSTVVRRSEGLLDMESLDVRPRDLRRVVVVMPAYNAEGTLERTFRDIPQDSVDEVILVDDVSRDRTVELARSLGITTVEHRENKGYGGNQKTCYREALARGADIVVMLHPDYQYDARVIPAMVTFLRLGICDAILGSRIRTRREALSCGMPWWKYGANRLLTFAENLAMGQNMGDAHTGLRAYTREVLETIPFENNSDDFVFDSQFLSQLVHFGFRIGDVPVPTRYFKQASSIDFRRSVRYGLLTLWTMVQFNLQRMRIARFPIYEARPDPGRADVSAIRGRASDEPVRR